MAKKHINKTLMSGKYPLAIFFIVSSLFSFGLFINIFMDLNMGNSDWGTDYELLKENIVSFLGCSVITLLLFYFKKTYKEEPTISFDNKYLYLEISNKTIQRISFDDFHELHRTLIQPTGGRASRWNISYLNDTNIEKLEILVIQKRNFTQLRNLIKKRYPSVQITGLLNSFT